MGVSDRQYMQRARPSGSFGRSTVGRLLIVCAIVFLVQGGLQSSAATVEHWFMLSRGALATGKLWTLVTYAFLHASVRHLFWNGIGIWVFGSLLEGAMPPREFVRFTVFAAIFSGVAFVATSAAPVVGISGVVSAYVVAAALRFPKTPFRFMFIPISIPLWLIAVGYVVTNVAGVGEGTGNVAHVAHLGGALYGAVCWKFGVLPSFSLPAALRLGKRYARSTGDQGAGQKAGQAPGYTRAEPLRRSDAERERVDALLEKISADGISSLSDAERTFLNEASKRYR